ncbi:hypothetical protein P154DRAFT_426973, partial [Amniculicola lignicola CBS 123094]
ENIYNIDKIGVILSILSSVKVLISVCIKRIVETTIEYISSNSRFLDLLIIWPALTY